MSRLIPKCGHFVDMRETVCGECYKEKDSRISRLEADIKTLDGMMDRMTENIVELKERAESAEAKLVEVDRYPEGRPIDLYGRYKYEVGFEAARAYFEPRLKTTEEESGRARKALNDALEYVQIAVKFLKYQRPGREFYPNREGAEACLGRIHAALAPTSDMEDGK